MREKKIRLQDCCIIGSDPSSQVVHALASLQNVHVLHCYSFESLCSKMGKDK